MTNTAGAVQGSLTTSAFGGTVASSGSSTSSYQFGATSGYRNDGDAGLVKVGCRYYDPQVGRFTSRDTYLDQKAYVYCDADPVDQVDPDGHVSLWSIGIKALAGLARMLVMEIKQEPDPIVGRNPPTIVGIANPPEFESPVAGSGGAVGGIATVGVGLGVGAQAADQAIKWRNTIAAYEGDDPEKDPPVTSGGF